VNKKEIIALLNQDLEGEHGAIIQYLGHAYAIGEGEMACEIEAIAREEMTHLDMLADTIVELGGTISLERGKMIVGGKSVAAWMKNNVQLELDAIAMYKEHIKLIGDAKIKRTLQRILSDEQSHHGDFAHFVDKSKRENAKDRRSNKQNKATRIIDWGIEHEYTVVLQYLLHSYMAKDGEIKKAMHVQSINEMQHMGWLSEEMVGSGGNPKMEHTAVDKSAKMADMLKADIKVEKEVAVKYDHATKEVSDAGLKKLLTRIRDHERYHTDVFSDLLKEAK
jgi:bacterioferritin